jgi:hypothetical protein
MRKLSFVALIALAWSFAPAARVGAWGFTGHKLITDRASDLLPPLIGRTRPARDRTQTDVAQAVRGEVLGASCLDQHGKGAGDEDRCGYRSS